MERPPRFRQSMAKVLLQECPAALAWQMGEGLHERKPTRGMERSTLVHAMVLGGAQFHTIGAKLKSGEDATDFKCPAAREEAERVRAAGFIPVFSTELELIRELANHIKQAIRDEGIDLDACEREQHHEWTSPEGIECEGTPDLRLVADGIWTYDIKVGYTANPDEWDRKLDTDHTDMQLSAYEEQAAFEHGNVPQQHFVIAAELEGWCPVTIMPVTESYMEEVGRKKWRRAKRRWQECWATGIWPGYRGRALVPPEYVVRREEFET